MFFGPFMTSRSAAPEVSCIARQKSWEPSGRTPEYFFAIIVLSHCGCKEEHQRSSPTVKARRKRPRPKSYLRFHQMIAFEISRVRRWVSWEVSIDGKLAI